MDDDDLASLEEILDAANEGGVPIIMDGHEVHSVEDVPGELLDENGKLIPPEGAVE